MAGDPVEQERCRKPGCGALKAAPCTDWDCPQKFVPYDELATLRTRLQAIEAETIERCAAVCNERGVKEQEAFGLTRATQNYFRARDAIRALSTSKGE